VDEQMMRLNKSKELRENIRAIKEMITGYR
jgi:hypothetical protein